MATVVRMPSVLAGAAEAAINKWLVAEGAEITVGAPLVELETEKAVVEYNAEVAGTLGRYLLAEGKSANIGEPICIVLAAGEDASAMDAALAELGGDSAAAAPVAAPVVAPAPVAAPIAAPMVAPVAAPNAAPVAAPVVVPAATAPIPAPTGSRIFASPLARKLAREHNLDLAALAGTGPEGRIVRADVEAAAAAKSSAPAAAGVSVSNVSSAPRANVVTEIPLSGMRKAIARRLLESKQTIPHFYLTAECNVDKLLALRAEINAAGGTKVSVNDFVILAVAKAFVDVPEANVTWGDNVIYQHSNVDISIAVSIDGGLITPVLRDASNKTLSAISGEVRDLAERGRSKRLQQAELEGGSFSISNLGMYDTLEFAAIINPPQSGILAVGAAKDQVVAVDGEMRIAKVMRVTLSADHRAVDGTLAAQWLAAFVKRIENPVTSLI
jgi:pyruvate dehydrogenase E2 component (dihydrolipoamide acetyltransferase)